jgi:hypothetical protein
MLLSLNLNEEFGRNYTKFTFVGRMQFPANFMTLSWCADLLPSLTIGFYGLAWLNYVSPNSYKLIQFTQG